MKILTILNIYNNCSFYDNINIIDFIIIPYSENFILKSYKYSAIVMGKLTTNLICWRKEQQIFRSTGKKKKANKI